MTLTDTTPRPLTHLSVRRVPARPLEPPYDDEVGASPAEKTEGALALAFPLASGVPAVPEPPLRLVPGPSRPSGPGEGSTLPPCGPWAARLVQAVVEVLGGDRPAAQLARWTVAGVYYDLQRMATRAARGRAVLATRSVADAVRSLHVSEPSYGVAEVCALVERAGRPRALALRLENRDGRWQCTVLRLV